MIKIAILGHSPDAFPDAKTLAYDIDNAIAIIKRQHNQEKDFIFLLNCEPGASQWFCNALMEQDLPYEIFLTAIPEEASKHWSEAQQERFIWQIGKAKATHICGMDNSVQSCINRDKRMVDESQWILSFWNGKHQGFTYRGIEAAINDNKIVYNGLGGIKIVDGKALKVSI